MEAEAEIANKVIYDGLKLKKKHFVSMNNIENISFLAAPLTLTKEHDK